MKASELRIGNLFIKNGMVHKVEVEGAFMDYMEIDSLGIPGLPMPTIILENLLHFAGSNYDFDAKPVVISGLGYLVIHNGEVVERFTEQSHKKL